MKHIWMKHIWIRHIWKVILWGALSSSSSSWASGVGEEVFDEFDKGLFKSGFKSQNALKEDLKEEMLAPLINGALLAQTSFKDIFIEGEGTFEEREEFYGLCQRSLSRLTAIAKARCVDREWSYSEDFQKKAIMAWSLEELILMMKQSFVYAQDTFLKRKGLTFDQRGTQTLNYKAAFIIKSKEAKELCDEKGWDFEKKVLAKIYDVNDALDTSVLETALSLINQAQKMKRDMLPFSSRGAYLNDDEEKREKIQQHITKYQNFLTAFLWVSEGVCRQQSWNFKVSILDKLLPPEDLNKIDPCVRNPKKRNGKSPKKRKSILLITSY